MFSQAFIHMHETIADARFALLQGVALRRGIKVSKIPFGYKADIPKDGIELRTTTLEGIVINMLPHLA
jgi:hypothetical protein